MERKRYDDPNYVDMEFEEQAVSSDESTSEVDEGTNQQDFESSEMETIDI